MPFQKTTIDILNGWLAQPENFKLEFKAAEVQFDKSRDLPDYCAALANEGGGKLILGVNNGHQVVGTRAFDGTYVKLSNELLNKIKIRVDVEEFLHPNGRVLIFHVPPHPAGVPIQSGGHLRYPMRAGESLKEMDQQTLKDIFSETTPDFSRQIVPGFSLNDIDDDAINNFKMLWSIKSKRPEYLRYDHRRILTSIGLLSNGGELNYAALILFGKKESIDRYLPDAEIIYEWRQETGKTSHDFRANWREPFFKIYDDIWNTVNDRNIRIPFQEGFIQREVYAYNEKSIREAVLNAVAHRDYTQSGRSIIIKTSPDQFTISSPGGFPLGITIDNILDECNWRNRIIAETFEKAGLVERSGQGMDDIFEATIREGKGLPHLNDSSENNVVLSIPAQVKDKKFILYLEEVANKKQITLGFDEIYELEKIREQQLTVSPKYKKQFIDLGIIEKIGRTSDTKYILSQQYYKYDSRPGVHTRIAGISRDKYKELILKHLSKYKKGFIGDFKDAFPELKSRDISNLLQELKSEGKIKFHGPKTTGHWMPVN